MNFLTNPTLIFHDRMGRETKKLLISIFQRADLSKVTNPNCFLEIYSRAQLILLLYSSKIA